MHDVGITRKDILQVNIANAEKTLVFQLLAGSWDKDLYIVAQCSKTFDIVIIQRVINTLLTDSVQILRDSVQILRDIDTIYHRHHQPI